MKKPLFLLYVISIISISSSKCLSQADSLKAFPGAEGFGAFTQGGRYGEVIIVTNLNDSGPGSLREACAESSARMVVFQVNGIIDLEKDIEISEPNITIAGHSAPGSGITVKGATFVIKTSEVIIRNIRFRPGSAGKQIDGLSILAGGSLTENILIDHCSFQWASDENIGINGINGGLRNITIQNCIIAEGLMTHSMGLLINKHVDGKGVNRISVRNNYFAHNHERNPVFGSNTTGDVVNNIIYNWRIKGSVYHSNVEADIIGNHWIPGSDTKGITRAIEIRGNPKLFLDGNYLYRETGKERVVISDSSFKISEDSLFEMTSAEIDFDELWENGDFGAYPRDSVDQRIVASLNERTGKIIFTEAEVGGFPLDELNANEPDNDGDGMPDSWENQNNLNAKDAKDAWDINLSNENDYPNLEIYLQEIHTNKRNIQHGDK